MFDQLVESSTTRRKSKRWAYFTVTATLWTALLIGIIVWGIMAFDAKLNEQFEQLAKLATPPPPAAAPPSEAPKPEVQPKVAKVESLAAAFKEPPKTIEKPRPPQPVVQNFGPVGPAGGSEGGGGSGPPGGFGPPGGADTGPPPPPPPPPEPEKPKPPPQIVRKSGGVLQGSATRRVQPTYPPLAKAARVSGAVVVEVTVDENGNVISARPMSGHALLKDAAVSAAQRWKFSPTQLSGVPVKVIGTITFNFSL